MIQDNYAKVGDYAQKALKEYGRYLLAESIDRLHKHQTMEENASRIGFSSGKSSLNLPRSGWYLQRTGQNSAIASEKHGQKSSIRQIEEKVTSLNENTSAEITPLAYGDYVQIENDEQTEMRVYSELDSLRLLRIEETSQNTVNFRSSCFQLCNPARKQARGRIQNRSLVSFRNVLTNKYITIVTDVSCNSELGYELQLESTLSESSLFVVSPDGILPDNPQGQDIFTDEAVHIRCYNNEKLVFSVGDDCTDAHLFCSYKLFQFKLRKVKVNACGGFKLPFFRLKSIVFGSFLEAEELDISALIIKKSFSFVELQDQHGGIEKSKTAIRLHSLSPKAFESELRVPEEIMKNTQSICQLWQLQKSEQTHFKIVHVASGQSLVGKDNQSVRLTTNLNKSSSFSIVSKASKSWQITDKQGSSLTVMRQKDTGKLNVRLSSQNFKRTDSESWCCDRFELQQVSQQETILLLNLLQVSSLLRNCYSYFEKWGFVIDAKCDSIRYEAEQVKLEEKPMRRKTKLLHKVLGRLVQLVSQHHPQFQLAQTVARELKVFELLVCCCKLFLLKMARWEEKHMERQSYDKLGREGPRESNEKPNIQGKSIMTAKERAMREPKVGTNANKAVRESKKAVRPMIGHSSLGKSESGYSPEPMLERECLGDGSGKSKMPPEWVVEQFEQLLRSVFRVILALVTNNKKCSEQLMRQAKFFNRLLELYPGEVGRIIQETIKNLSLLTTQAVRQENDSLFQWTKLIACVTTESVQIQKNYIDIIAQVVVDPNDIGILPYQNKVRELLFTQRTKRKILPKFSLVRSPKQAQVSPCVFFEHEFPNQFLEKNNLDEIIWMQDSITFPLRSFYHFRQKVESTLAYSDYLTSLVHLIRNLCRGRNRKLAKTVEDWGLNYEHITLVLRCQHIGWELLAAYLSLYAVLFIDQQPFLPFSKRETKCHVWEQISSYSLNSKTGLLFRQYTDRTTMIDKHRQFDRHVLPLLDKFFSWIPHLTEQHLLVQPFVSFLKTLIESVNYGFLSQAEIRKYVRLALNKASDLFRVCQVTDVLERIAVVVAQLLLKTEKVTIGVQGITILKTIESREGNLTIEELNHSCFLALEGHLIEGETILETHALNMNSLQLRDTFDQEVRSFALQMLSDIRIKQHSQGFRKLVQFIELSDQRSCQLNEFLQSLLILNGGMEDKLYQNYSGRTPNELLNVLKIRQLCGCIVGEQGKTGSDQESYRLEKILELNNFLSKMLRDLHGYRQDNFKVFRHCQRILEKLGVHETLISIVDYADRPAYRELVATIYTFYHQFTLLNEPNLKILARRQFLPRMTKRFAYPCQPLLLSKIFLWVPQPSAAFCALLNCLDHKCDQEEKELILETLYRILAVCTCQQLRQMMINRLTISLLAKEFEDYFVGTKCSINFARIVCILCKDSPLILRKLQSIHAKSSLLSHLSVADSYYSKRVFLSLYYTLYIKSIDMDLLEFEFIVNSFLLPQLKHLPSIVQATVLDQIELIPEGKRNQQIEHPKDSGTQRDFNRETTASKQDTRQLLQLRFREIALEDTIGVSASSSEQYRDYLMLCQDKREMSLLNFLQELLNKWSGSSEFIVMRKLMDYLERAAALLDAACTTNSNQYQELLVCKLHQLLQLGNRQKNTSQEEFHKRNQIQRYLRDLAQILRREDVGYQKLVSHTKVDQKVLQARRNGEQVEGKYLLQGQFLELVSSLGELISNQREFLALNSYPQTILFFKAFRDPSRDRIDVYVFMQKLTEMLEFQNSRDIQLFSRNVTSQTDNDQSSAVLRGQSLVKQREIMFDRTSIETCLLVTYKDCMRDKLTECFMKVLKNLKALERWAGRGLGEMSQIHEKHKRLPIIDSLIATVLKTLNKNGKKLASSAKEEQVYSTFLFQQAKERSRLPEVMCIVQQLYLLLGKSKVVFSLAENILTQAESWPNHLVLDKSYFQLVFNRYHSLVKSILGEQTLPQQYRLDIDKRLTHILCKAIVAFERDSCVFWFDICTTLLRHLICSSQGKGDVAAIIAQDQLLMHCFKTLMLQLLTSFAFNTALRRVLRNKLTVFFLKLVIKFYAQQEQRQYIAQIISRLPFSEIFETICRTRASQHKGVSMQTCMFAEEDEEGKTSQKQYECSVTTCTFNQCGLGRASAHQVLVNQITIQLLIILKISSQLFIGGHFQARILAKNRQLLIAIHQEKETIIQLHFDRICSIEVIFPAKTGRINHEGCQREYRSRIFFELPELVKYRSPNISDSVLCKLNCLGKDEIPVQVYQQSIVLQDELEKCKLYSQSLLLGKLFLHQETLYILLSILLLALCLNLIFAVVSLPHSLFIVLTLLLLGVEIANATKVTNELRKQIYSTVKLKQITCKQILLQLVQSKLLLIILLLLTYILMLAWEQFAALAFLLHLARTVHVPLLICDIVQALFHIRWMLVVWFMALLIAAEIMRLPDTTTTNLLSSLVQLINSISPPSFDPNTEPLIWNHVALVSALEFICLLTFSVFCGALIAQLTQRGEWRRRQKRACLMCLKDKSLLESKHGSFQSHIHKEHNVWSYMYFFISLRRKGLQSAGAAVSKMVRMGDFSFIKFA